MGCCAVGSGLHPQLHGALLRAAEARREAFPASALPRLACCVDYGWANSSLNPIIYAFNADFHKAFCILLGCHRLYPGGHNIGAVQSKQEMTHDSHSTDSSLNAKVAFLLRPV
ncbi:D(1) dopamine receptor [Lates japonicus]|uniref:D(1) dopamine receptor n=1 Tax=Lates japonicus TaxID=270547 RepID=A0AAD3NJN4_LATJO|nr:D(1) dopamine receptor [Lates japonicus]